MLLPRRNLPLNAMRCFEAAARHCHLRRAGEELGVTHGAVSRQIRLLEEALGVALFQRGHNRLQLTSAGQRLLQAVQEGFDHIARGARYLDPKSMAGSLTVLTTPSIAVYWAIRVVGGFGAAYPEVDLRLLNIEPGQRQMPAEFDVAICYGEPEVAYLRVLELYREQLFPVASPRLLASGPVVAVPTDLLEYRLIHDRHRLWRIWLDAHAPAHSRHTRSLYAQESFQAIQCAREGFGIALADRIEVARELLDGSLVRLMDATVTGPRPVVLVCDEEARLPLRVQVFIEHLLSELAV